MEHTPYTYFIGWTKLNLFYYGSRYAKGCHPSDFWEKYFTSSKRVAATRLEHGEPDLIQIRQVFDDVRSAMLWEKVVLRRMNAKRRKDFLNETMGNMPTMSGKTHTDETKAKMSAWQKGVPKPAEATAKMRKSLTGRKLTDEARAAISRGHQGLKFTDEHKATIAADKLGRKWWNKDGASKSQRECPGEGWMPGRAKGPNFGRKKK